MARSNRFTESLRDKTDPSEAEMLLFLFLDLRETMAHVSLIKKQIVFFKSRCAVKKFCVGKNGLFFLDIISSLEDELSKEQEWIDYAIKQYCPDTGKFGKAGKVSQSASKWR